LNGMVLIQPNGLQVIFAWPVPCEAHVIGVTKIVFSEIIASQQMSDA